jgi:1-acyl-sn-glycerol-3-phosphate acyltransferase
VSELFYNIVHTIGSAIFWVSSKPTLLHVDRSRRKGAYILASNHHSPYDVPLLIYHTKRKLDFVSTVEVFSNRFAAWFYGNMNAFPLDRSKPDSPTVRTILDRLARGRVVAMFPEGGFRKPADSVINGGRIRPSIGRLAQMASVPVIPVVVLDSKVYMSLTAWLPLKRMRYGLIYGDPITLRPDLPKQEAAAAMEEDLKAAFMCLNQELLAVFKPRAED